MTVPKTKGLSRREQLLLRVIDEVADDAEQQELRSLDIVDVNLDTQLRQGAELRLLVSQALRPVLAPELVDGVMRELELPQGIGPQLRASLAAPNLPELADDVLAVLTEAGLEESPTARATSDALRSALACGPTPELADDVFERLQLQATDLGDQVRAALETDTSPDLVDDTLTATGLADDELGPLLRETLFAAQTPDLTDAVMASLGLAQDQDLGDSLRDALTASAPDLAGDVMAALGIDIDDAGVGERDQDDAEAAKVVPLRPNRAPAPVIRRSVPAARTVPIDNVVRGTTWRFPAVAVAAAAALVMFFVGAPTGSSSDQLAFQLSPINHVDIEELLAGDQVMVQVLQLDENAPTIIYIDEMAEDDGGMPL